MASQGCCQGQFVGRCNRRRRARLAIRAGMLISCARIVAGRARACRAEANVAAARVRLYAIAASTVHAPFAEKDWSATTLVDTVLSREFVSHPQLS